MSDLDEATLRRVIREELSQQDFEPEKLAYSLDEAASAMGVSLSLLKEQIAKHNLVAVYVNSKSLLLKTDLLDWLQRLPTDRKRR